MPALVRFGAGSSVESIQIQLPVQGEGSGGFEVIRESLEKRAAAVSGARDAYSTWPASLHWYGSRFGHNAYLALMDLAEIDGQQIKCCTGRSEEVTGGLQALQTAKAIVVDISALATLRLLGLERILSSTKFNFIISEHTWVTFQTMLLNARILDAPSGTLTIEDGKNVIYEHTAEQKAQRLREDRGFVQFVEQFTERKGAPALAAVEPDRRELLVKLFGSYGAESVVLASDPDYVLWTDDLVQAHLAGQEFGDRRVWTQLVLGALTDAGLLTPDEYGDASAKLVGMEFAVTLFDGSSMIAALKLAGWALDKRPAAQIIKTFADERTDLQRLVKIFVEFTARLYRESVDPGTRCSVTQKFLDTLAARTGALALLHELRRLTPRVFGLNEIGRVQFENCFDSWLRHRGGPIIHLP